MTLSITDNLFYSEFSTSKTTIDFRITISINFSLQLSVNSNNELIVSNVQNYFTKYFTKLNAIPVMAIELRSGNAGYTKLFPTNI